MHVVENEPFDGLTPGDLTALRRLLKGNLLLRESGWVITRNVGHVSLPSGLVLHVRSPKAPTATLLSWLCYDDPALRALRLLGEAPDAAGAGELGPVLARMFARELHRGFGRHGVSRMYLGATSREASLRGRIDFPALLRVGGDMSRVPCRTFERRTQTPLNALFAETLAVISRDKAMRDSLRHVGGALRAALDGVVPRASEAMLKGGALPRHESGFERAYRLALLILRVTHMGDGTDRRGPAFLVNVEALFERTVARAWQASTYKVATQQRFYYRRVAPAGSSKRRNMTADVMCTDSRVGPLVIDAKFKSKVDSANLQQMVSYCHFSGASRAVLVLPAGSKHDGSMYELRGASGTIRIAVVGMELDAGGAEEWRERGRTLVADSLAAFGRVNDRSSVAS